MEEQQKEWREKVEQRKELRERLNQCNIQQQCLEYYHRRANNASESQIEQDIRVLKQKKKIEVPPEYQQLSQTIKEYKSNLIQKFQSREHSLITELQQQAIRLKKEIAFYTKQTSKENIDFLIAKKRAQKETQRLTLQVQWRQLNQKLKKLEEEQKKLKDINKQSEFDLESLNKKIKQLRSANSQLRNQIDTIRQKNRNFPYITQFARQSKCINKQNEGLFNFGQIQKKKQPTRLPKQHLNQADSIEIKDLKKRFNEHRILSLKSNSENSYDQLMNYLALPQIRDRIFEILGRKID